MKFQLPSAVTRKVGRQILLTKKHSPTILFVGGIVGVVATTVTACRATLKAEEVFDRHAHMAEIIQAAYDKDENYTDKDRQKDQLHNYVQTTVKFTRLYGPSIILGAASITMLSKSHNILTKRNAGLTAAYAVLDAGFTEYRGRVVDELGEEKDREFRFGTREVTEITEDKNGPKKVKSKKFESASVYARVFEEFSTPCWENHGPSNLMFLQGQQKYANDLLRTRGHIFLNDIYDALGYDRTPEGSQVGWLFQKGVREDKVDFGIFSDEAALRLHSFITDREKAILLDFNVSGVIWPEI